MKNKKCSICKELKPVDAFSVDNSKPSGRQSLCKSCKSKYRKAHTDKNREYRERHIDKIDPNRRKRYSIRKLKAIIAAMADKKKKIEREGKKLCKGCGQWLDLSCYSRDANNSTGLHRRCRICARHLYINRRGRLVGIQETITRKEVWSIYNTFDHRCFKCGSVDSLSLDHHVVGLPLSFSNAVLLCKRCNSSKSRKDPAEFYDVAELSELSRLGIEHK